MFTEPVFNQTFIFAYPGAPCPRIPWHAAISECVHNPENLGTDKLLTAEV